MSNLTLTGPVIGNNLQTLLGAEDIHPGDQPSYELCKTIYEFHPIGKKMVDAPIMMAQSQPRIITIQKGPEERLTEAFEQEWAMIGADRYIANARRLSRIYGISSIALVTEGVDPKKDIDWDKLYGAKIAFNVFDPLNTAGSLVLSQIPNSIDFLKTTTIIVQGQPYSASRTVIILNEEPIYLSYTSSAFGFVGRSVYQRVLFPLKSYVQSMVTDDMITRKAGLLVAMMNMGGSAVDNLMKRMAGIKRELLKEAEVTQVISIGVDEKIESLNLTNVSQPYELARKNILENIATGADMPAIILKEETFSSGLADGTEDAKNVARYVARERIVMDPIYRFFDKIVQYRAWNRDFYETLQVDFPEYKKIPYETAFTDWQNSYHAAWPNLLEEPDSEKSKVDAVKLDAIVELLQVLLPVVDPENRATIVKWAADNFNELDRLFGSQLELDWDALESYEPPTVMAAEGVDKPPPKPQPNPKAKAKTKSDSDNVKQMIVDALRKSRGKVV